MRNEMTGTGPGVVEPPPLPPRGEDRAGDASRAGAPSAGDAGLRGIRAALREHAPVFVLLGVYLVARIVWTGGQWPLERSTMAALAPAFGVLAVLVFVPVFVGHAFRVTHREPGTFAAFRWPTWVRFRREYLSARRLTSVVIGWGLLMVFVPLFVHWKADIGASFPFAWDERFMRWDRALHFGRHPWEWLHPLLARPRLTAAIDTLYHPVWVAGVKPGVLLLMAWSSRRVLAMRFILSYMLLFMLLGTALAYALASAGPVFYGDVVATADDPFTALKAYLAGVDARYGLGAMSASSLLWDGFVERAWPRVGISAMPSMHVALAALVVVLGFHVHRVWGVLASLYLAVILIGSVHLAWHYAIDAYVSLLLVWPVWWSAGRFLAWRGDP